MAAVFVFVVVLAAVFAVVLPLVVVLVNEFVFVTKITFDGKLALVVAAFASTAEFAFVSTPVLAFASVVGVASVGVSATVSKTDTPPFSAGIASIRAVNIKIVAAVIVIFDKIVCEPRG